MVRTYRSLLVVGLCAAAIGISAASAQEQKGGRGRGGFTFSRGTGSLVSLANNEAVQKELALGEEEKSKLTKLSEEYRAAAQKEMSAAGIDFQGLRDLPDDQRRTKMAEFGTKSQEVTRKLTEQFNPKVKEALSAEQLTRLKQIQIQSMGSAALNDPEIAKELAITEEQKKKLADVSAEYRKKQSELFGNDNAQDRFAKLRELREEQDTKTTEVLTAEQKEKLAKLKGKEFDVAQLRGGRGTSRRPNQNN